LLALSYNYLIDYFTIISNLGIGATPAAGQIDPKAIARQAIMK